MGIFFGTIPSLIFGIFLLSILIVHIIKRVPLRILLSWCAFFALGVVRSFFLVYEPPTGNIGTLATEEGREVVIHGVLSEFPDRRYTHTKWVVSVLGYENGDVFFEGEKERKRGNIEYMNWKISSGKILVSLPFYRQDLVLGDKIVLSGKLKIPFEGEKFSYKNYLLREHIYAIMAYPHVSVTGKRVFFPLLSPLFSVRKHFDTLLTNYILAPESAFANGILVGERSGFSPERTEEFRRTGLSHMLALSGYNVTLMCIFVFFITFFLPKPFRIFLTLLFLVFFVFFVGGGSSIIRASIMGGVGLMVLHMGRKADGIYTLLLASVLMGLLHPFVFAYDPSFQLSFFGVLGIILFSSHLRQFFSRFCPWKFWTEIFVATLSAQLGVLPLLLFLFGEISFIAPVANLLLAPILPLAMLLSFAVVVFGSFSSVLGFMFGLFAWTLIYVCLWGISLLASIPYASIPLSLTAFQVWGFAFLSCGVWSVWSIRRE